MPEPGEVRRAAELLNRSNIKALWCFLLGGPEEDEATLGQTIKFINKDISKKDNAFITVGIRVYPQTGMHELAVKEGVIDSKNDLLMPTFYFSNKLTPEDTRAILLSRLEDKGRVIFLTDTNFSSLGPLRLIGTTLKLPSPFWSYAGYMNMLISRSRVIHRGWEK